VKRKVDDPAQAAAACFNMTPMIDVCFQLIVVFLCSMKFRTLDQKIEAFLPPDGMSPVISDRPPETRVDLRLKRSGTSAETRVLLLDRDLGTTADPRLWATVESRLLEIAGRDPGALGRIAADPEVTHAAVMRALDAFAAARIANVSFRGTTLSRDGRLGPVPPR